MKVYLEHLYHYCCEYCEKWWSIADVEPPEIYSCPHCCHAGYVDAVMDKNNTMTNTTNSTGTTRAKFCVQSVTNFAYSTIAVALSPVVGGDSTENDNFFKSTPSGEIKITIKNPALADFFQPGLEYYIDFTPVVQPTNSDDEDAVAANA